jgi:hypothetical protein
MSDPLASPLRILPADTSISISFDGGFRDGKGAWAVFYNADVFYYAMVGGHPSSFLAESLGALNALRLVLNALQHNPHVRNVQVRGDNFAVVAALAERSEWSKALPGRSPAPNTWREIATLRQDIDKLLSERAHPTDVSFLWLPRRYNKAADLLCNAALDGTSPPFDFTSCVMQPPPTPIAEPSLDDLSAIADKAARGQLRPAFRTIAPTLKRAWHGALSTVAAWEHGEFALALAAAVLLQKFGQSPAEHLQRIATRPNLVRELYWHAAHDEPLLPQDRPASAPDDKSRWAHIQQLAASRPAKAIKMLTATPVATPAQSSEAAARRLHTPLQVLPDHDHQPKRPAWIKAETIMAAVAHMPRVVAPGPCGWTRETLLASFCRPTVPVFERIINALATDTLHPHLAALMRAVRIAAWSKPESPDFRIVGMSSTLTKATWRILSHRHLASTNMGPNQALFTAGGIFGVCRWAHAAFHEGLPVALDDIADAYWSVNRSRLFSLLHECHSPLALMFRAVYGTAAICSHGPHLYSAGSGILPGCGGASLLHAIDTSHDLRGADNPRSSAIYADDITTTDLAAREVIHKRLAPKSIHATKSIILHKNGPTALPLHVRHLWRPAARLLGGYIGDVDAAKQLFANDIAGRLETLATITQATDEQLSPQVKFCMIRSVEISIRWKYMASHPTVSAHSSMSVDDRLFDSLASLLPADVPPPSTHKSRTLLFTPQASGGLGVMNFSAQGSALYDVASAQAPWPPVKLRGADEDVVRFGLSSKQVGDALLAAMPLQPQIIGLHELNARADASRPWFAISPTTKYLRIDPAAWRLAFANYLRVAVDYPSCGNHDSTLDGSQTCHRCGGPYRYPRHQVVQFAIQRACVRYGILATENLHRTLGAQSSQKRPDLMIYRNIIDMPPLTLDVSIPHQSEHHTYNAVLKMWNAKQVKYKDWFSEVVAFAPLIFSTAAAAHPRTLDVLKSLSAVAASKGFFVDCVARIKVALVNFELFRRKAIQVRHAAGTLTTDPCYDDEPE